ncbi:FUSC family protein, partial [[Kitasatospora] papulosa]
AEATARHAGSPTADPAPRVAELEALLGRVRLSLGPLVHPLSPFRARRARAGQVLALLDVCVREVRGLASVAADPEASHDARLAAACWRVETSVETLTSRVRRYRAAAAVEGVLAPVHVAEPALAHLHSLERALAELAAPLHSSPRSPLVGA